MAKMFYTIEEAGAKLGKSEAEVKQMVETGQLSEFRDRDRLMFKAEQVDLLAEAGSSSYGLAGGSSAGSSAGSKGGSSMSDILKLADSGEMDIAPAASNAASASAVPVVDSNPKEQTGISIFEAEMTEEADPSAVTRVTPSMAGGSALGGSGLLDATREGGDSALGVNAINDAYGTGAGLAGAAAAPAGDQLFEGATSTEAVTPAPLLAAMAEPYDGAGSGLIGGAALGMIVALAVGLVAVLLALSGGGSLLDTLGGNMMAIAGGALGVTLVAAVLGWVIGRKS